MVHSVCFTVTAAELHAAVIAAGTFWCCAFGCCDARHVYNPLLLIAIFPPLPSDHLQEGEPLALLLKYTMCTVCTLYTIVHCAHYTYWWYHMHGTFAAFSLQLQFALFAANYFECLHCGLIVVQHYLVQGGMRGREGSGLLFILTPLCSVWVRREGCLCLFSRVQFIVTPVHWCAIHECQWRVSVFSPVCRL